MDCLEHILLFGTKGLFGTKWNIFLVRNTAKCSEQRRTKNLPVATPICIGGLLRILFCNQIVPFNQMGARDLVPYLSVVAGNGVDCLAGCVTEHASVELLGGQNPNFEISRFGVFV